MDFQDFQVCLSGKYIYFIDKKVNVIQYDLNSKSFQQLIQFRQSDETYQFPKIIQSNNNHRLFHVAVGQYHTLTYIIYLNDDCTKVEFNVEFESYNLQFSNDTKFLYNQTNKMEKIIDSFSINCNQTQDKLVQKLDQQQFIHSSSIRQFFITSDDKFLFSSQELPRIIFKWNILQREIVQQLEIDHYSINLSQNINQFLIVTNGSDHIPSFYDKDNFQLLGKSIRLGIIVSCPNNNKFIILGMGILQVWNILKDKQLILGNMDFTIPKGGDDQQYINDIKWDDSKIHSHLNFDLRNIWTQKRN